MAYDWLNEPAEALPSALHAVELEPDNAIVLAILAEVYTDLGDLDAAQAAIDRALQLAPDNFIVQRNDGYLMEAGYYDYDAAIDAYRRALQAAPTQVYAAFDLARVYHYNGDYQEEVETLRQIVERNPENAAAYYQLGNAQWTILGEFEQARNTLERCTSIAPNQVDCLSDLGFLQLREGEYNLCARSYDRAIQAGSANPYDYVYGGTCHIVIDECGRATDILRQALDLTDDLDVLGDIRDGLAQCQVVITLEPTATLPAPAAATATAAAP